MKSKRRFARRLAFAVWIAFAAIVFVSCGASSAPNASEEKSDPPKEKIVNGIKVKIIDGNEVKIFDETAFAVFDEFKADKKAAEAKYAGKPLKFTGMIDHMNKDDSGRKFVAVRFNDDRYDFRKIEFVLKAGEEAKTAPLALGSVVTLSGTFKTLLPTMFLVLEDATFQ